MGPEPPSIHDGQGPVKPVKPVKLSPDEMMVDDDGTPVYIHIHVHVYFTSTWSRKLKEQEDARAQGPPPPSRRSSSVQDVEGRLTAGGCRRREPIVAAGNSSMFNTVARWPR